MAAFSFISVVVVVGLSMVLAMVVLLISFYALNVVQYSHAIYVGQFNLREPCFASHFCSVDIFIYCSAFASTRFSL